MPQTATSAPPAINRHLRNLLPYPPGKPIEEVRREFGLDQVYKLASNENPLGPSPKALKAMAAVAGEMNLYPDASGHYLTQALSDRLGVSPQEILLGNGSDEIIVFLALAYLSKSRGMVTSDYAFVRYRMAAELAGAPCTLVPMRDMRHDLKAMAAAITPGISVVCLDLPGNPTGTSVTRRELETFLRAIRPDVLVVLDQAYYEFAVADKDYPDGLQFRSRYPNLVVTRTFSKAYGLAGLRIGYAVARHEIITDLNRIRPPFNTTRLSQAAALASLDDQAHLRRGFQTNAKGITQMQRGYDRLGLRHWPSLANFILVDVGQDCRSVFEALLHEGIVTRPMAGIGLPTCLRISVGTSPQNKACLSALGRVLGPGKGPTR